ncbi:dihydrofolate reductase family protein [Granulicoccus sp. GXG6511]|uniref:dihydrofolate reductase family protein n=1 Tax=Granulicoccus sp. GXG6511 TaxID=3381351 RepID=UPI003D7D1D1B
MSDRLAFRVLSGPEDLPRTLGVGSLGRAYAWPARPTVRANFITTLDGSIAGPDGLSGSLGTAADQAVFHHLRDTCEAIVVGAGTVRDEGYGPPPSGTPLVIVSRQAAIPAGLITCPDVVLATCSAAGTALDRAIRDLGDDRVWVLGEQDVSARLLRDQLFDRGHRRILHEGGPSLATQWLGAECIDELCLTVVPRLGDNGPRLVASAGRPVELTSLVVLQESATLLTRWAVVRRD